MIEKSKNDLDRWNVMVCEYQNEYMLRVKKKSVDKKSIFCHLQYFSFSFW